MNGGIIPPTPFTKLLSKATLLSITSALGHGSLSSQATEPQQSATTHAVELPTELALPLSDDQHLTGIYLGRVFLVAHMWVGRR